LYQEPSDHCVPGRDAVELFGLQRSENRLPHANTFSPSSRSYLAPYFSATGSRLDFGVFRALAVVHPEDTRINDAGRRLYAYKHVKLSLFTGVLSHLRALVWRITVADNAGQFAIREIRDAIYILRCMGPGPPNSVTDTALPQLSSSGLAAGLCSHNQLGNAVRVT
jgi:hypothetical protein